MPYLPIPDYRSSKIYISNPCLVWGRLQLVDLFLISFLAIETSPSNNAENVAWIKGDIYDCWYCALDILGSSFVVEVAKIIVDGEAATTASQKDKKNFVEDSKQGARRGFLAGNNKVAPHILDVCNG